MSQVQKKRAENAQPATRASAPDLFERLFDWSPRTFDLPSFFAGRMPELFRNGEGAVVPPMNISEDAKGYEVTIELPGLEEKDIEVEVLGRQLVVSAERTWKEEDEDKRYHRVESRYGSLQRSMTLPEDARVDLDAIEARYDKGVLHVHVPKAEPTPKRKIEVKGKAR